MTGIANVNSVTPDFIDQLNQNFAAIDAALDGMVDDVRDVAHGGTGVTGFGLTTACTSNQTLTADQSYQTFTNIGASGGVTLTLPTPAAGLQFSFVVATAQTLTIGVAGLVVIALGEIPSSAGGNVSSNSAFSAVTLKAISSTLWVATSVVGTWNPS